MLTEITTFESTEGRDFLARKLAFTTGPVEVSQRIEEGGDSGIFDVRELIQR